MEDYSIEKPKSGLLKIIFLGIILLIVLGVVLVSLYLTKAYRPASHSAQAVEFAILPGTSTRLTAENLKDQKLITSTSVFLIYSYINNASAKIQAGEYELSRNMSIAEIVEVLTHGRVIPSDRSVTILEGWTNAQIANDLEDRQLVATTQDFDAILSSGNYNFKFAETAKQFSYEGFLYPDTYKINRNGTAQDLIVKMLANFESKITNQMLADIESQNRTLAEVIILASIIEKEVGRNKSVITADDIALMQEERRLVASVFMNRLKIGMGLESDATVNYITGKGMRSVTIADTKIDSPYNTYRYKGLPPGPISNPSLNSIMAAIYPAQSEYYYFLNSPEGTAYYGKTLQEHGQNREKYLR